MSKKDVIDRINNKKNLLLFNCYEGDWDRALDDFSYLLEEISKYTYIADSPKFYFYNEGIESLTEEEDETGFVHYKNQDGKSVRDPFLKKIEPGNTKETIQEILQRNVNSIKNSIMDRDIDSLKNNLRCFFDCLETYVIIPDWPEIKILDREEAMEWMGH